MKQSASNNSPHESLLDDVIDEIATQMNDGQSVDIEEYVSKFPDIAEPLREAQAALAGVCQFRQEGEKAIEHRTQTELDVPRELGDFRLIREIGRGGMGIVYEAEQVSLQRPVALKVLPYAAVLDQRQLRRFRNEARAAAMLKHPHIVSVHAVGCERGIHFYAMELVEGRSLAEIVAHVGGIGSADDASNLSGEALRENGPTPSADTDPIGQLTTSFSSDRASYCRTVARIGMEAASSLQYAHTEGVIHRDIKPSNLLLDRDGKLLVADFGLAHTQWGDDITATGDMVGTLRYMSPEQLTGDRVVDQRTDIYSLGLTLYEMIACKPAFTGNDRHALSQQIIDGHLTPLIKLDRGVPRDLETIIQKAASREADERYMTAAEMAEDLRLFIERRPIKARRSSQLLHLRRWSRRNPMVAALAATVFLLLTVVSIAGIGGSVHLSNAAKHTKMMLYASDMRRAAQLFRDGDTLQAIKTLQRHVPGKRETDERHFEWFYLRSLCDQFSPKWTLGHPVSAYDARFSPDGKLLATCTWTAQAYVWDVTTGQQLHALLGHRKRTSKVLFSPDGSTLISGSHDGTIRLWDVESGKQRGMIGDPEKPKFEVLDLRLSPDGRHVAAVCRHPPSSFHAEGVTRSVVVWEYESKQQVARLDGLGGEAASLGFSPDSRYLIVGNDDGKIHIWSCQSWQLARSVGAHANGVQAVAYSPDGATCASASFVRHSDFTRAEVKIWDASQWNVRHAIQHHDAKVTEIDYSPGGRWLLVASNDYNVSIWNVADGKCVKSFRPHAARVFAARMSPDHTYLATASADNFVKVWNRADLIRPSETRSCQEVSDYVYSLTLADEGRSVITGDILGQITKRDTASGATHYRFSVASPTDSRIQVTVSPDNQWLAVASGRKTNDIESGEVQIRNLETGVLRLRFPTPKACMHGLDFGPDGKSLALGCRQAVFVFDRETGNSTHQLGPFRYVKQVKWSPTGHQLAVAENTGWTSIFNSSDYSQLARFRTDDGWGTIGFDYSPDGKAFASGGGDKAVKIWDAQTFKLIDTFDECPDWIAHVAFSADGRRVLSTGKDGVLRVWHRDLGECLLTLNTGPLWSMNGRFSPDGRTIAAATDVLRIWRCKSQFKTIPIYAPPNRPCHEAMELQTAVTAE